MKLTKTLLSPILQSRRLPMHFAWFPEPRSWTVAVDGVSVNAETPPFWVGFLVLLGSLTITYFHTGNPHYHRRGVVSRSCSGWEG
ncbi:hypothetical protein, partial [Burkholderia sp. 4M9327F10]|uniref:hypothetical protein n=1 Tax=Burkholderia sp. 4M9327F10 TaxID=2502223 RepID=UPI001BB2C1B5